MIVAAGHSHSGVAGRSTMDTTRGWPTDWAFWRWALVVWHFVQMSRNTPVVTADRKISAFAA